MKIGVRLIDKKTGLPVTEVFTFKGIILLSIMAMVLAISVLCSMDMGNGQSIITSILDLEE